MISPHAGGPFVEQATAAPGELRVVATEPTSWSDFWAKVKDSRRCKALLQGQRCERAADHDGDHLASWGDDAE